MKKIFLTLTVIALFISSSNAGDKSFDRGTLAIDIGAGVSLYGTKLHSETPTLKKDTSDGAASYQFPIRVEFGITPRIGLGIHFNSSNFIGEEKDSASGSTPKVRGGNYGLFVNYHFLRTAHFDFPVSVTFGYSSFNYKSNNVDDAIAKSGGTFLGISLTPRIYFGKHIGISFSTGYIGYNYPKMEFSDNKGTVFNEELSIKMNGVNLGVGVMVKF